MRFYNGKKNSHIFMNGAIVGRFVNGIFDTEDKKLIKDLSKKYKSSETPQEIKINEPGEAAEEEDAEEAELITGEAAEEKSGKDAEIEKIKAMEWQDLLSYASDKGVYKVGMSKTKVLNAVIKFIEAE